MSMSAFAAKINSFFKKTRIQLKHDVIFKTSNYNVV